MLRPLFQGMDSSGTSVESCSRARSLYFNLGKNFYEYNLNNIAGALCLQHACTCAACLPICFASGTASNAPEPCSPWPAAIMYMWATLPAFSATSYIPSIVLERPLFTRYVLRRQPRRHAMGANAWARIAGILS